jgi:hypothetical protein
MISSSPVAGPCSPAVRRLYTHDLGTLPEVTKGAAR